MLPRTTSIWQRDSQPNASGKPGTVQLGELGGIGPALPTFAEVRMTEVETTAPQAQPASSIGLILIDLPGGVRVSVDATVDAGALARVLSVLG